MRLKENSKRKIWNSHPEKIQIHQCNKRLAFIYISLCILRDSWPSFNTSAAFGWRPCSHLLTCLIKIELTPEFCLTAKEKGVQLPTRGQIYCRGSSHVIESRGRGFLVYVQRGLLSAATAILWVKIGNLLRLGCFDFSGMTWVYRRLNLETGYNSDSRTVPVQPLQETLEKTMWWTPIGIFSIKQKIL